MTVRRLVRIPIHRLVTIALVLLAQVQLLWVGALHQHESLAQPQSTTIRPGRAGKQPALAYSEVLCPACQVVRHNAARTSARILALRPRVSTESLPDIAFPDFYSRDLRVRYGRAPPLS